MDGDNEELLKEIAELKIKIKELKIIHLPCDHKIMELEDSKIILGEE